MTVKIWSNEDMRRAYIDGRNGERDYVIRRIKGMQLLDKTITNQIIKELYGTEPDINSPTKTEVKSKC